MMKKKLYLLITILFASVLFGQKRCNLYEVSLDDRIQASSLVVEGIVKSQHAVWDNAHRNIYTISQVEVLGLFKGTNATTNIEVATPGGTLGDKKHSFGASLNLTEGQTGVFILKPNTYNVSGSSAVYELCALSQGFIQYLPESKKAKGIFDSYTSLENDLFKKIEQKTSQTFRRSKEIPWSKVNSRLSDVEEDHNTNATQKGVLATSITTFSPTTIQAGRDVQLTITGTGFGSTQGTSYVSFKNASDGGSTYINAYSNQYVSWSDTQIVVKVPGDAGTGTIRVNVGGTNYTSTGTLTVDYAIATFDYTSSGTTYEYNGLLRNQNGTGGYTFKYTADVVTNGKTYFETAVKSWRCTTGVQFLISATASTATTIADDNENTVDYDALGTGSGVIAQAVSRFSGCSSSGSFKWYVDEIDVQVNSSLTYYYGTATSFSNYDYYTAVLHELGHANQLGHVIDSATTPTKIMHYSLATGQYRRTIDTGASTGGTYWVGQSTASANCTSTVHKTMNCTSTVTLSTSASSVSENGTSFTVTATQNQVNYADVVVNLSYSGTASSSSDYTSVSSITIPAGSLSASATITLTNDSTYEGSETVIIDISSVTDGTENGTQQQTVTITDNETAPTVTLSTDVSSFTEGGSTRTVTATLSGSSAVATTVTLAYTGTATYGTDYTVSGTGATITINAGATTGSLTITNTDDAIYEGTETIIIDIASVTNATENGTQQNTINLYDNDTAPTVTISASPTSIAEASGVSTITATQSAVSGVATTITLTISGTAESTDYTQATTITIPAGSTTATITCTAVQDTVDEANETVISDITAVTNATESGTQKVTITITDDDASPTVTIATSPTSISETGGTATISATSSVVSEQDITVNYSLSGTATQNTDYSTVSNYILIPAGSTSSSTNMVINATSDTIDEADETVIVDVSTVTNGTESGTQQKTVTITDDDATPTVTLTVGATTISETSGSTTVTATLSAVSGQAVTVNLGLTGTATTTTDYTLATSISIPAGSTSASITLASVSDVLDEANETVIIDITSATNATESGAQQQTVTITDDDATPTVTLSTGTATIAETSGSTTVTATLSAVSGQTVTVNLGLTGTATTTTDYTLTTSISIPAGSISASLTLASVSDTMDENDETVIIDVTTVTNATESGTQQKTVTITDDDSAPNVCIAWTNTSIGEGASGTSNAVATLSAVSGFAVTVNLTWGGTATLNSDYTVTGSTITIPAGSTSGYVTMNNITDTLYEMTGGNSEYITVTMSSATNATIPSTVACPNNATMTQNDDDAIPTVTLSKGASSINETGGSTTLTATLSAVSGVSTTVNLSYSGTATSGTDYSNVSSIVIPAGSLSASTTISAISDATAESNETIIADISSVTNATENGVQQQTITINDDDTLPTVTLSTSATSITEGDTTTITITATASNIYSQNTVVNLGFGGDTTYNSDYTCANSITILAGQTTGTTTFTVIDDVIDEQPQPAIIYIAGVTNGTESGVQEVTITINDNDVAPYASIQFLTTSVNEANTTVTVRATLSAISEQDVNINYTTSGTAIYNSDYTETWGGTFTVPAGSLTSDFTLNILEDTTDENDENYIIGIQSVTNGTINPSFTNATLTIVDNDAPPSVSLSATNLTVSENGGSTTVTATLSEISGKDVTVVCGVNSGSSTAYGTDVSFPTGTVVTIPAGSLSTSFTIVGKDDTLLEGNETLVIEIYAVTNGTESGSQVLNFTIDDNEDDVTTINLKLFLEGYYNTTTHAMTPAKFNQGASTDSDDVDDITVELRNSANGSLVASTTAVLDTGGFASATFNASYTGSYYIVVKHRSSIEAWSKYSEAITGGTNIYDFSNANDKTYGFNVKEMESGVFAFYSGDVNQDGFVDAFDVVPVVNDVDALVEGYHATDINGDGFVDSFDLPMLYNNNDNLVEVLKPYTTSRRKK